MKILFPVLFISALFSAQEKDKKQPSPKTDSIKLRKKIFDTKNSDLKGQPAQKDIYRMPNAKPDEKSVYSSLKDKKIDTTDYKMLNSIAPDKKQKQLSLKNK